MKKAFDQTVRDIKRGVNKKVLKVPSIEQKVLDATSNEPWGPHGSLLADIAQATRNYHEYQMIMSVIWKRVNDTGKNWRHVYKALTVLEYLVANGSERVIEEIKEHAYQISTLSDFQYIDSTGRDQGSNVRKKSQSLVALVNDKERIVEVRQKAAANREKFRNTQGGGMYRPGSYSGPEGYDDDRYGGRYGSSYEDRNGYGREREWGDDKYGRYGDSYGRDGDRYGEDRYSRDGYRDEEYRGRSQSIGADRYGSRSRSADRERERSYGDDGQYSNRGSNARAEDRLPDGSVEGRPLERKYSEQNLAAPPSYEDAVGEGRSPVHSERDGETSAAAPPKSSSPPVGTNHQETPAYAAPAASSPPPAAAAVATPPSPAPAASNKENDSFDEFDPRGSFSAAPTPPTSGGAEMDLLGSLSDSFSSNALALVPSTTETSEADASHNSNPGQTFAATSSVSNQTFDDPFGDGPFRAIPSTEGVSGQTESLSSFSAEPPQTPAPTPESSNNFGAGDSFNQTTDILGDILPPPAPSQTGFPSQHTGFPPQNGQPSYPTSFPGQPSFQTGQPLSPPNFPSQGGQPMPQNGFQTPGGHPMPQNGFQAQGGQSMQHQGFPNQVGQSIPQQGFLPQGGQSISHPGFQPQGGQSTPMGGYPPQVGFSQAGFPGSNGQPAQPTGNFYGGFPHQGSSPPASQYNPSNYQPQMQSSSLISSQPAITASTGALAIVPQQPAKETKFETKSTVWTDTLNRGLVNLNISGPKTNPLSDIGVDFEAINRKEKRMEKPSATPVTSNVTMGKAMGSGSGIGRAGATALRAPPNPMMGPGMGIGMGAAPGMGPGYGGAYGGMNQPMGMNNMPQNMGMGMNMGQGFQMQQPMGGFPPGSNMPGNYNPMMGRGGGYGQQPYGGYR